MTELFYYERREKAELFGDVHNQRCSELRVTDTKGETGSFESCEGHLQRQKFISL